MSRRSTHATYPSSRPARSAHWQPLPRRLQPDCVCTKGCVGVAGAGSAARLGATCAREAQPHPLTRSHANDDKHTAHRQPALRSSASRLPSTTGMTWREKEACTRAAGAAAEPALRAELRRAAPERERAGLRAAGQPRRLQRDEPPAGRHRRRHAAAVQPHPRPFRPRQAECQHQAGAAGTAVVSMQLAVCHCMPACQRPPLVPASPS